MRDSNSVGHDCNSVARDSNSVGHDSSSVVTNVERPVSAYQGVAMVWGAMRWAGIASTSSRAAGA